MIEPRSRRRRTVLLAACALGLTLSASACRSQVLICGVLPPDDPAVAGK